MRTEFSKTVKWETYQRALKDGKPHCQLCGTRILGVPEYDHIKPDGLGGTATADNCQCLCGRCHRIKTHTEDRPVMTKADNQRKASAGIKRKHKWPKRGFGQ